MDQHGCGRFKSIHSRLRLNLKAGLLENAFIKSDLLFKYLIFHFGFLITKEASRSSCSCQFFKAEMSVQLIRHCTKSPSPDQF